MNTIYITAYFAAPLGLLIMGLALNVSKVRIQNKVSLGDGDNKVVRGAIRAHGNAVEYIPIILILLFIYELQGGNLIVLWVMGAMLVASRFFHAWGMLRHIFIFRRYGATVTYIVGVLLPIFILGQVLLPSQ